MIPAVLGLPRLMLALALGPRVVAEIRGGRPTLRWPLLETSLLIVPYALAVSVATLVRRV